MSATTPHIDSPELLRPWQKARDTFMTALMWGVYAYLWAPFVSLLAWLAGAEAAYEVMVRSGGASDLIELGGWYAFIVAVILGVVTAWSYFNRARFRGRERRGSVRRPIDAEVAEYFGVTPAELERLRRERIVTIGIDPAGRPVMAAGASSPARLIGAAS